MKRQKVFMVCVLVIALLVSIGITAAQGGVPPVPSNDTQAVLLFPDLIQDGAVTPGATQQRYILLAGSGDVMVITAQMSQAGSITSLALSDAAGSPLVQQAANSAAPTVITLGYQAPAAGWYLLDVMLGQAAAASSFTVSLTGTTPDVFTLLKAGAPPAVAKAHVIASTVQLSGTLGNEAISYLIPVDTGDQVAFAFQGTSQPRLKLSTFANGAAVAAGTLEPAQTGTAFTSDKAQWVQVDVMPSQAGTFTLGVTHPRTSGMVSAFAAASTGLTLVTPPQGAPTAQPGAGSSAPLCGGIPARFKVDDVLVVSHKGDDLIMLLDYTSGSSDAVEIANAGDQLQVQKDPVCYKSSNLAQETWFWNVYSFKKNVYGWVADGQGADRWVCPTTDPACDEQVPCPPAPVQFQVNDMIVVSQAGDNLKLLQYPGTDAAINLAVWKQKLKVLGGPVCYKSLVDNTPVIYWNVFSDKDGAAGWVVDGLDGQRWVCPEANPTCDKK